MLLIKIILIIITTTVLIMSLRDLLYNKTTQDFLTVMCFMLYLIYLVCS